MCDHDNATNAHRYCPDCGRLNPDFGKPAIVQGFDADGEAYDLESPVTMRDLA